MYIERNIIYADPGKYLKYNKGYAFQVPAQNDVQEYELSLDDIYIEGSFVYFNNKKFIQYVDPKWTYSDYKRSIITSRYSNDDQIAIILNKEDSDLDLIKYNRMMKWREFASVLANKIINLSNGSH